ncbi:uncharacterized protein LOC129587640 [Paramacrobiotus metropolitanus]|uniref:uncharacterized protein LOC129587640 n=1 Tax=Paramacrobiotus metropolitanus TaxID=2943436 RepID=UPI0024462643|nr:uncharacterized protein LOC129587640 [Paramacrobiotus metropolitanus]
MVIPLYTDQQIQQMRLAYAVLYMCFTGLCTVGSTFNLCILTCTHYKRHTSLRCYMLTTSIADLMALWLGAPRQIFRLSSIFKTELGAWVELNQDGIQAANCLLQGGQLTFMYLSDWILVVFAMERLLILVSPFRFGFLQRPTAARTIVAILTVVSLLYSLFLYVQGFVAFTVSDWPKWILTWSNIQRVADIVSVPVTFFLILLPSAALIIFLAHQRKSEISHLRVHGSSTSNGSSKTSTAYSSPANTKRNTRSQTGTNLILLGSATFYTLTRFPFVVFLFLDPADYVDQSPFMFSLPLFNLAIYSAYTFTFFVYVVSDEQFRQHFVKLIVQPILAHCTRCRQRRTGDSNGRSSSGNKRYHKVPPMSPLTSKALLTPVSSV